jgi:hypothetical protein
MEAAEMMLMRLVRAREPVSPPVSGRAVFKTKRFEASSSLLYFLFPLYPTSGISSHLIAASSSRTRPFLGG